MRRPAVRSPAAAVAWRRRESASGSNVILPDPDVAEVFPDAATVNAVLRVLAKLILRQRKKLRPTTPR